MATTYTQADLVAINKALASGQKKVRLNNREVEYQSVNQMMKAKESIANELAVAEEQAGTRTKRPRSFRAQCNKGL